MTKPLYGTVNPSDLSDYIGYRMHVPVAANRSEDMTIAAVHDAILPGDPVRVELVEYPGYHIDVTGQVMVYATVEPAKPAEPLPDLIDRDGDRWLPLADGRYAYSSLTMTCDELHVSEYAPVRDA